MTNEQEVAFTIAQSVAAYAEIEGMKAANRQREASGHSAAYGEDAFQKVIINYGLDFNTLVERFRS